MRMKKAKSVNTMLMALLLGITAFLVSRGVQNHQRERDFAQNVSSLENDTTSVLAWMKKELNLTDEEFAKECRIHEEHMVEYHRLCEEMKASRERLTQALQNNNELNSEGQAAIRDYETHFEACERAVIQHVKHVAAAMNPKAGQTYLKLMIPHLFPEHEIIPTKTVSPPDSP
jgi:hypothetical protein